MTTISDMRTFYTDVDDTARKVLAEVSELGLAIEMNGPDRGAAIMAIEHIVFVHAKGADGFLDKRKADAVWEAVMSRSFAGSLHEGLRSMAGLGVEMGQSRGKTLN